MFRTLHATITSTYLLLNTWLMVDDGTLKLQMENAYGMKQWHEVRQGLMLMTARRLVV